MDIIPKGSPPVTHLLQPCVSWLQLPPFQISDPSNGLIHWLSCSAHHLITLPLNILTLINKGALGGHQTITLDLELVTAKGCVCVSTSLAMSCWC